MVGIAGRVQAGVVPRLPANRTSIDARHRATRRACTACTVHRAGDGGDEGAAGGSVDGRATPCAGIAAAVNPVGPLDRREPRAAGETRCCVARFIAAGEPGNSTSRAASEPATRAAARDAGQSSGG